MDIQTVMDKNYGYIPQNFIKKKSQDYTVKLDIRSDQLFI